MSYRQRDYQKSKVYKWENTHVAPHDKSQVPFENIQSIVDYIWAAEGLRYPPRATMLAKQNTTSAGTGCRLEVSFPEEGARTWVIIHELAHAMRASIDVVENAEVNDRHGPGFVGTYMRLLAKYLNLNLPVLMHTANKMKVDFDIMATSPFLD